MDVLKPKGEGNQQRHLTSVLVLLRLQLHVREDHAAIVSWIFWGHVIH